MRIKKLYSHLNGHEWILVHQKKNWGQIEGIISRVDAAKFKTKISKEKGMRGKRFFAPIELNKRFAAEFRKAHWSESRTIHWLQHNHDL